MNRLLDRIADLPQRKRELLALRLRAQANALADQNGAEPIAVIGIGCRFPGNVDGPDGLWQLLRDGVDAVKEIPADRWDIEEYYDPNPATPGKMNTRWGGFIDNVDRFDASFFGISPREAKSMDPQQRLLLEVSWEALEDAGQAGKKLAGSQTGVFIGICRNDYGQLHGVMENPSLIDAYFGTGNASSFAAGRLSYLLGLNGPSLAIDTACSSSLVAVHLACQSLHSGECRMAMAGGVNLILSPVVNIYLSQLRTFAPDGRCKAFDDKADGYVRGEGCGVVVLKKLSDALADDDHILAVIRGSAINQDGRSAGLTAPNGPAQEAVIRKALANAGVDPLAVDFVEAHGTGTSLGDPIEMRAIGEVLGKGREKDKPLIVASVKSNLGHLEAAAGIAGLIKLILATQHGEIPRQLHFNEPSSYIPWRDLPVAVPTNRLPWKHHNKLRLGAVSSFGFSGTNAHVLVEEYQAGAREEESGAGAMSGGQFVLPLSAQDEAGLQQLARKYGARLEGQEEAGEQLRDVCYSAAVRRAHHGRRLALVGATAAEMRAQLEGYLRGVEIAGLYVGKQGEGERRGRGSSVGVVFVFSGQGGQWWGMGRELLASEPVFRASLKECAELFAAHTREWDLWEEWSRSESETRLASEEIVITQCGLFALQVSLARLWRSYGVEPGAVIGHSLGEVAAAAVAGVLELEDAVRVVYERSRLLRAAQGRGGMAAVELGAAEAEALLARYAGRVSVAADNGQRASVVSGEREAITEIVAELERQGVMVRELRSSGVGGHSEQVAVVSAALPQVLAGVRGRRSEVALISTVTGQEVNGETVDGDYWARNVRERVRFREGMETLARRSEAVYVEMNAHPVLGLWVREALATERGNAGTVIGALRRERGEREVTLAGLAEVYAAGVEINWETVWRGGGARYVPLPSYPWQRQRFWIERPEPDQRPQIFSEAELSDDPRLRRVVESIVEKWGRDGALAVNRRYLAPFGFIGTKQESLFYFNLRGTSIVALLYVGPDDQYEPLVQELLKYAEEQGYQLNLIATESGIGVLQGLNFSTTPCGSFQSISDLRSFTLCGNKMRRLRYQVDHYKRQGKCVTIEYQAGSVSNTDREIVEIIDDWVTFKKTKVPFANDLKQDITRGTLDSRLRLFLTYVDETLESVVLISPAFASGGYLMDLEFYRQTTRPGCLEFAITEIIKQLADEGHSYFSLGGSFGTQLNSHPNANPEVERLFVTLRQEEVLNGDGNFQFKNKFRPETSALYLCHPKRYDPASLSDVLLTLAGEGADAVTNRPARTVPMNGTSKSRQLPPAIISPRRQLHPLLGEKLQLAMRDVVFQSQHTINSLPFLQDHKIGGVAVLPGTTYIEMGLAAAKETFGPGPHSLLDLSLQQAMVFSDTGAQTIQLVVKSENDGVASFQILSTPSEELNDSPPWSLHATGTLRVASPSSSVEQGPSIEDIRTRCAEEITGEQYYGLLEEYGFEYGEAFQGVTHVWRRDGEAIAQIQIPESLSAEIGNYRIHPALLDACLQVFEATIKTERNGQGDVYLLRGAEEISLYVDQPKRVWSHVVLHETGGTTSGLFTGDLKLYDDSGQTVAEVRRIYAKRASTDFLLRNTQQWLSDWLYEIEWRRLSREPQPETSNSPQRAWLILSDGNGIGEKLQAQLKSKSQPCVIVYAGEKDEVNGDQIHIDPTNPEDFRRLLEDVSVVLSPGPIGLVNLWSIDSAPQDETVQGIAESVRTSCSGVLYLTQALIEKGPQDLRLWVVTRGAQAVDKASYSHEALGQSPLWGLGRVISVEHPEMWGGLIDLDPDEAALASKQLGEELLRPIEGETQIAYRNGHRYVARLTHSSLSQLNSAPLDFKSGSTYLVTGGLGGLGLECARWMAEHGAKHIALVSRRDPDDASREKLSRIEKIGSQVRIFKADVTDETHVGQVIAEISKSMPPLRGVVNAAGVLDDGMIHTQTWDQFQRVLDPKVKGSYLLHQHTSAMQLDFFVLFSSAASMFGSAGQANHAAANAFLDALAHYRRGLGRPALSVNWGAWSEIGEAAARNVGERLSAKGIDPIEPEQGWRALEMIFKHSSAQVGVIPIDWKKWKQLYLGADTPPLMSELMQEPASPFTNRAVSRNPKLKEEFSATPSDKRQAFVEAYLARETARVLRMDVSKLALQQPLSELGIDSIMTVELRDVIDVDWQVKVPLVEFFREPTIERLASIVLGQLAPTSTPTPADPAMLLAQLDKMSETDVDNLLGVMLAKQDEALPEPQTATF